MSHKGFFQRLDFDVSFQVDHCLVGLSQKSYYYYTSIDPKQFSSIGCAYKGRICGAKMNAHRKLTSRQYKRGGLRNAEKEFYFMMPRPCRTAGHERPEARTHGGPELAKSGHMADKERTHGGHTRGRHKRRTRREGGHMATYAYKIGGRHKADTWRTRFGGTAKADSRRTHGGQCGGAAKGESRRTQGEQWRTHG